MAKAKWKTIRVVVELRTCDPFDNERDYTQEVHSMLRNEDCFPPNPKRGKPVAKGWSRVVDATIKNTAKTVTGRLRKVGDRWA